MAPLRSVLAAEHRRLASGLSAFIGACCLACGSVAVAGPPFLTDDPEPVEPGHWEVYLSSVQQHNGSGLSGTLPHIEVNHGAAPNLQLHLIVPWAFNQPPGQSTAFGYGDMELGAKYRFIQEKRGQPMVGTFPLIEVPTGSARRGLGTGHLQVFLPIWLQKGWGHWTSYGGGGYHINPGPGNRDYWFVGWEVQKDLDKHLTLGGEVFHTTPATVGGRSDLAFNLGGQYNFDEGHHLLFSAGRSLDGDTDFMGYFGFQWTFGPPEPEQGGVAPETPHEHGG